ncbi:MAG: TIM barrel protein [Sphingobacteriaceae bacterium]
MKSAVTIALVPAIKSGPWIFWQDLEAGMKKAAVLGFDAVELFTASADAIDVSLVKQLSAMFKMPVCAVGTGAGKVIHGLTLTDPDAGIRSKAIAFIQDMIAFGAALQAPAIIGSMQGSTIAGVSRAQSLQWLGEALHILAQTAESLSVPLIYEPLNRYETNLFNRFTETVDFIETLDTNNIKLLADLFHMNIEEQSIPETILKYGRYIGHIHFADSNRQAIGLGHTDIQPIAAALKTIGYQGGISAEIFPLPDQDTAARQTIDAFKLWFGK